jgi:hypothetical protein
MILRILDALHSRIFDRQLSLLQCAVFSSDADIYSLKSQLSIQMPPQRHNVLRRLYTSALLAVLEYCSLLTETHLPSALSLGDCPSWHPPRPLFRWTHGANDRLLSSN